MNEVIDISDALRKVENLKALRERASQALHLRRVLDAMVTEFERGRASIGRKDWTYPNRGVETQALALYDALMLVRSVLTGYIELWIAAELNTEETNYE